MKRSFAVFMILILVFSFTGCKKETPVEELEEPGNEVESNEIPDNDAEESSKDDIESDDTQDNDVPLELSGLDLIKSLNPEPFENMVVETETTGYEGMKMTTTMYFEGENYRSEFETFEGQKQVTIFLAEEGGNLSVYGRRTSWYQIL